MTDTVMDVGASAEAMQVDGSSAAFESAVWKGKGKAKASHAASGDGAVGDNLPWVEKYRPVHLADLVSHEKITNTIMRFIDQGKLPHMLFYGPPGTGKTSTILACARRLYGDQYKRMILELNASDDRGIDVVREQIKTFAEQRSFIKTCSFKLIILDEADAMTQVAQAALRRLIEKYTTNVRFCLICNYVSKIIPALQSRCTRFRFHPLETDEIKGRIEYICSQENVSVSPTGLEAVLKLSHGDMRRALNVLQSTFAAYGHVDEAGVYFTTANPLPEDMERVAGWLLNEEFTTAVNHMQALRIDKGYALQDMLDDLFQFMQSMAMPEVAKMHLYDGIAEIEYKLAQGCNERIMASALASVFRIAVELVAKHGTAQQ